MRTFIRFIPILSVSLLLACSDDTKQPGPDAAQTKDGPALKSDKGSTADMPQAKNEASTGGETCNQIGECQKTCGIDTTCLEACKAKGCPSAKTAIDALTACAIAKCLAKCVKGFDATCNACSSVECATEYNACVSHTC